jgi:hypothetical protein
MYIYLTLSSYKMKRILYKATKGEWATNLCIKAISN